MKRGNIKFKKSKQNFAFLKIIQQYEEISCSPYLGSMNIQFLRHTLVPLDSSKSYDITAPEDSVTSHHRDVIKHPQVAVDWPCN